MAFSINGIGTTWYGQRDFRPDGTYLTTEWFAVLFFPVIPLRSLRMKYTGEKMYAIYEVSFPNWKQVLYTYGFVAFMIAWVYFVGSVTLSIFPLAFHSAQGVCLTCIVWLLPSPTPWLLRWYALRNFRSN